MSSIKKKKMRNLVAVVILIALAVVLGACGGGNETDVGPTQAPVQSPTVEPTATNVPPASPTQSPATEPSPTASPVQTPTVEPSTGVSGDEVAEEGDQVAVHYEGTLDSGETFDESRSRGQTLDFVLGQGSLIAGFEAAVSGMEVGEIKTVRIEPADAYGERRDDLILELPREGAPEGLEAGDSVRMSNGATVTIVEIRDDVVVIDANHPLAGEALTFEIELMSIEKNGGANSP